MSLPKTVIIIPARYGSTRFQGKPLHPILGITMLERVWRIAKAVKNVSGVYIATDDTRILEHAKNFGAEAVMTPLECRNGTERAQAALAHLPQKPDAVINFQGDAVLTPPWVLQAIANELNTNPSATMVTPAVQMSWEQVDQLIEAKRTTPASGTVVVVDNALNALYFSKTMIPFVRGRVSGFGFRVSQEGGACWDDTRYPIPDTPSPKPETLSPYLRHIGLYGYRTAVLERLNALPPSPLEELEQLEQLRALENGIGIKIVLVDYLGRTHWSVDSPEDAITAAEIIGREGELVEVLN
jgi:3-deoxy-manno-octulosonate cytidylyltransferase (CMP-KDO synthetase)